MEPVVYPIRPQHPIFKDHAAFAVPIFLMGAAQERQQFQQQMMIVGMHTDPVHQHLGKMLLLHSIPQDFLQSFIIEDRIRCQVPNDDSNILAGKNILINRYINGLRHKPVPLLSEISISLKL